jgi:uncharacterized membrane protein YcaP (DUF421 family)
LPLLEIFARGSLMYLGLLTLVRIVGQREAGAIGLHDLLVIVLIADAAQNGLTGDYQSVPDGLLLVATILGWSVAIDAIAWRWPRLGRILKPAPRPLIENGRLNRRVMRRELITLDEVLAQLRLRGIEDISEVKRAYIEPNGMISVIRRDRREVETPEPHALA